MTFDKWLLPPCFGNLPLCHHLCRSVPSQGHWKTHMWPEWNGACQRFLVNLVDLKNHTNQRLCLNAPKHQAKSRGALFFVQKGSLFQQQIKLIDYDNDDFPPSPSKSPPTGHRLCPVVPSVPGNRRCTMTMVPLVTLTFFLCKQPSYSAYQTLMWQHRESGWQFPMTLLYHPKHYSSVLLLWLVHPWKHSLIWANLRLWNVLVDGYLKGVKRIITDTHC